MHPQRSYYHLRQKAEENTLKERELSFREFVQSEMRKLEQIKHETIVENLNNKNELLTSTNIQAIQSLEANHSQKVFKLEQEKNHTYCIMAHL